MTDQHYDPQAVAFYDVAHEGAQIRAVANVVAGGGFNRLEARRGPRSVVILAADAVAQAAARLAVAMRSPLALPVVVDKSLPAYVGPLDVVIAVTEKSDDYALGKALSVADSRGCDTVFAGLSEGPLYNQAEESGAIIIPHLPTAQGVSPLRTVATVLAVLDCVGGECDIIAQELIASADDVDAELSACTPERDDVVNPARALADLGARIVHTGHEHVGMAIAPIAAALWTMHGKPSAVLDFEELGMSRALFNTSSAEDIFYDPDIDGPREDAVDIVVWNATEPRIARGNAQFISDATSTTNGSVLRLVARAFATTVFLANH